MKGIALDPTKANAIEAMKPPTTYTQFMSFMGEYPMLVDLF